VNPAVPTLAANAAVRAFVAVELGETALAALREQQDHLAAAAPRRAVRWTRPEQCHLTLCFLGNVPAARIPELTRSLETSLAGCAAFSLELDAAGAFPSLAAPRVIWLGLRGDLEALHDLQQRVVNAAAGFGEHREERDFHPHLTLGRVTARDARTARALGDLIARAPAPPTAAWRVSAVRLFKSVLQPEGAVYSMLASFPLGAAA
jgi:2'-5' RNA ligase